MTTGLGETRKLKISEITEWGAMLDNEGEDIYIPGSDLTKEHVLGDEVEVFIFKNKKDEPEATTQLPSIKLNEAGMVVIEGVSDTVAYVNIGTKRDILIPKKDQHFPLKEGQRVMMSLRKNPWKDNLYGSTQIRDLYRSKLTPFERGEKVEVQVFEKVDIGRRVLIKGEYIGLLLEKEIFTSLKTGDVLKAYIRDINGSDIYLSMHREGKERIDDACKNIMDFLNAHKGYARLGDNSPPEEIEVRLKMSKKTFKQACGQLYKSKKIIITKRGIKLPKE